jgi:predicted DCC family thiol-disulfide oxidoreductase YuxK
MSKIRARLIYDGACIFCDAYVRLLSLREAVGPVELIDVRSGDLRLRAYQSAGYDVNEGMLFEYNGTVYFGADAMNVLAILSTPVNLIESTARCYRSDLLLGSFILYLNSVARLP